MTTDPDVPIPLSGKDRGELIRRTRKWERAVKEAQTAELELRLWVDQTVERYNPPFYPADVDVSSGVIRPGRPPAPIRVVPVTVPDAQNRPPGGRRGPKAPA